MSIAATATPSRSRINGWSFDDVHLETHHGEQTHLPPYSHDRYQIGHTTRDPGAYDCANREWLAPQGSIVLFNPGEIHEPVGRSSVRPVAMPARIMFLTLLKVVRIASSGSGSHVALPSSATSSLRTPASRVISSKCTSCWNHRRPRTSRRKARC